VPTTLIVVHDGEFVARGTPFDAEIEHDMVRRAPELRRTRQPLLLWLNLRAGTATGWYVSVPGDSLTTAADAPRQVASHSFDPPEVSPAPQVETPAVTAQSVIQSQVSNTPAPAAATASAPASHHTETAPPTAEAATSKPPPSVEQPPPAPPESIQPSSELAYVPVTTPAAAVAAETPRPPSDFDLAKLAEALATVPQVTASSPEPELADALPPRHELQPPTPAPAKAPVPVLQDPTPAEALAATRPAQEELPPPATPQTLPDAPPAVSASHAPRGHDPSPPEGGLASSVALTLALDLPVAENASVSIVGTDPVADAPPTVSASHAPRGHDPSPPEGGLPTPVALTLALAPPAAENASVSIVGTDPFGLPEPESGEGEPVVAATGPRSFYLVGGIGLLIGGTGMLVLSLRRPKAALPTSLITRSLEQPTK
jgi:hypothetical protein